MCEKIEFKLIITKIILIGFVLVFPYLSQLYADWEPDVRLTDDDDDSWTSFNNARCVTGNGNTIHIVWYDIRDGNWEIYYKRSTDGGTNWGPDTRLTDDGDGSVAPSVAVSGSYVHVVWVDNRDENNEIYYKRSTNGGTNWGSDTRLTDDGAVSATPSVAVSGSYIHVVWMDNRDENLEIYYKRSTNGGTNWGSDTRLTDDSDGSCYPSIVVSSSYIHIVWHDNRDENYEIYYKRSTNGGTNWGSDTRLTDDDAISLYPCVGVSKSNVHVVWQDTRDGWPYTEIYYKLSTNGGTNWGSDTRLTEDAFHSDSPSIVVSKSYIHVVWRDTRDYNLEIYYKQRYVDGPSCWGPDTRLTDNPAKSLNPSIAVSSGKVHVVWTDERDENYEIYYKRNTSEGRTKEMSRQDASTLWNAVTEITNDNISSMQSAVRLTQVSNPIRESGTIKYTVSEKRELSIRIYDNCGRIAKTLFEGERMPGNYAVIWDTRDDCGRLLPAGTYHTITESDRKKTYRKLLLIR